MYFGVISRVRGLGESCATFRWLVPFWNVYGLFGQINNTSSIRASFTLPGSGGINYVLNADGGVNGIETVLTAGCAFTSDLIV